MLMFKRGENIVTYGDYDDMITPCVAELLHSYWGLHYDTLPEKHNWCMMDKCAIFWQEVGDPKFVQPVGWTNVTYWMKDDIILEELCIHPIVVHKAKEYLDMLIWNCLNVLGQRTVIIQDLRLQDQLPDWHVCETHLELDLPEVPHGFEN